jgi:hypothetical protein
MLSIRVNRPAGRTRANRVTVASLALILAAIAAAAMPGCSRGQMPEEESYAGQLYVHRCGQCHAAYNPHTMTAAMWDTQVDLMAAKMQQAGLAPLSDDQRTAILDYLHRNAGTQ